MILGGGCGDTVSYAENVLHRRIIASRKQESKHRAKEMREYGQPDEVWKMTERKKETVTGKRLRTLQGATSK